MSYSSNPGKDFSSIEGITSQLTSLKPGELIRVHLAPGQIGRARLLVYEYLFSRGMKKLFRVRTRTFGLEIERLGLRLDAIEVQRSFPKHLESILEDLIKCHAPDARIRELRNSGTIQPEEERILLDKLEELFAK